MEKPENILKQKKPFLWQGKGYQRVLVIQNHDVHMGFGALIIYALNGIRKAREIDAVPVIDFNAKNTLYFHDASKGNNIWEYFFEKISPYSPSDIVAMLDQSIISRNQIKYLSSEEAAHMHHHDPNRLATFWAWEKPVDKEAWMKEKRALGRAYVQKYIKPRANIENKAADFINQYFKADLVIGVQIRGTDFSYAAPTPIETYLDNIDELLSRRESADYQIFVATDQTQYLEIFKEHHGEKVLSWDAMRSDNYISPVRYEHVSGYQKGEEVLIDMLLLSRCNHVFKGAAAVGELALWFCDHNQIEDFAIQSDFYRKSYGELESAYAQLNIGKKGALQVKLQKLRGRTVRRLTATRIGRVLFFRYAWARKILKQ